MRCGGGALHLYRRLGVRRCLTNILLQIEGECAKKVYHYFRGLQSGKEHRIKAACKTIRLLASQYGFHSDRNRKGISGNGNPNGYRNGRTGKYYENQRKACAIHLADD